MVVIERCRLVLISHAGTFLSLLRCVSFLFLDPVYYGATSLRVREHASVVFWFRFLLLLLAIQFFANLDRLFVSENICETHFCR